MRILVFIAALTLAGAMGLSMSAWGAGSLQWEAEPGGEKILNLEIRDAPPEVTTRAAMAVSYDSLSGLDPETVEAGSESVHFQLGRDAGKFRFSGQFAPGHGRGEAEFLPDEGFLAAISALGPGPVTPLQLLVLAAHDVKLEDVRDLATRGYRNLTFAELVGMLVQGRGGMMPQTRGLLGMDPLHAGGLVSFRR